MNSNLLALRCKSGVRRFVQQFGYDIHRADKNEIPRDLPSEIRETIARVRSFTMTTPERIAALCTGVEYVVRNDIPGVMVECGVWRGGSMMAVALTLLRLGVSDRGLYLFDTFEGMSQPTTFDRTTGSGDRAADLLALADRNDHVWAYSSLEEVRATLAATGYPAERIHFVKGPVEQTLPSAAPETIAVLRLDTDWYESTKHELVHLYPRLVKGGVLVVDDYGYWDGARRACDEYIAENDVSILLNRIDFTGRVAVKTAV